ncbi:hypothetical protein KLP40_18075 [Hymenobacter sp. NST-14]|uniref:hypothetical protein n=1 Tax=Hymenobacter piscis TaxID=2839984 RepID=UPI001C02342D|nr:hypothetical protein [Hymenobacter piscis]MBT9395080.1 hypothetical protein [Hymenobacter piscis]
MKQPQYTLADLKVGNHVRFKRNGITDCDLYWTVIGFYGGMVRVKIKEMGCDDEIFIDVADIKQVLDVNDTRYIKKP